MTYAVQRGESRTRLRWEWAWWSRTPPTEQSKKKKKRKQKSFVSLHNQTSASTCIYQSSFSTRQSIIIRGTHDQRRSTSRKTCQQDRLVWAPSPFNELLIIATLPYLADRLRASAEHMEPAELHHHLGRKQRLRRCITICCLKTFTRACVWLFFFFFYTGFPSVMNSSRPAASGPQEGSPVDGLKSRLLIHVCTNWYIRYTILI